MAPRSTFAQTLQPDAPLVQNAEYQFDAGDRQYIDQQATDMQRLLSAGLLNGVVATFYFTATGVSKGDVVCLAPNALGLAYVVTAAAGAMSAAVAITGIALTNAAPGTYVQIAIGGDLVKSLTGLTGTHPYVRVSSTGRCEEVNAYTVGDYPVGTVNASGVLSIARDIRGATQGSATLSALTCTGNATVGGTLGVSGNVTLGGAVACSTTLAVAGASTLTGNVGCGGTLGVAGASTLTGNVGCGGNLAVAGNSTLTGNLSCGGNLVVAGTSTLTGNVGCGGNVACASLSCGGSATIVGSLLVEGGLEVFGAVGCTGALESDISVTAPVHKFGALITETRVQQGNPSADPASWKGAGDGTWTALAFGGELDVPVNVPQGATIVSYFVVYQGAAAHAGLPNNLPSVSLQYHDLVAFNHGVVANGTGSDASANTTAFQLEHPITINNGGAGIGHVVDKTTRRYYVKVIAETNISDGIVGAVYYGLSVTYTRAIGSNVGQD